MARQLPDDDLLGEAQRFAEEIGDLLTRTVCPYDDPVIKAVAEGDRVVVTPFNRRGDATALPLQIDGEHRLDLRVQLLLTWDGERRFLAVERSAFQLKWPDGEPLVRFEYERSRGWAQSHVQLHAESSMLGALLAHAGTEKPPKTQVLHLPTGGPRFRPSLEDVIEFAVKDLGVQAEPRWKARIDAGRDSWRRLQLAAAIRDEVRLRPESAPDELIRTVNEITGTVRAPGD